MRGQRAMHSPTPARARFGLRRSLQRWAAAAGRFAADAGRGVNAEEFDLTLAEGQADKPGGGAGEDGADCDPQCRRRSRSAVAAVAATAGGPAVAAEARRAPEGRGRRSLR